jgi:NTE family protein
MGLRWDYIHYRNTLGALESLLTHNAAFDNNHYFSYRARLNYNSEDDWYFPTRGAQFKARYAYITDNFVKLDDHSGMSEVSAQWRKSFTFGKRFTLQPMVYGRMLFGRTIPLIFGNTVGGEWFGHYVEQQMPFAGIGNMEYVANQFVAAQLQGQLRIATSHYVLLRLAVAEQSEKLKDLFKNRMLYGIQGAYYYKTVFGPLGASFGYSNRTKQPYFYLNLGYEF